MPDLTDKQLYERKKRVRRTKEELKDVYINPAEMELEIETYYQNGEISKNLAEMIMKIAVRLSLARNFYNYSYKIDMQGDAIIKMMMALRRKRFKCGCGYNPFSYFTKVAYRAFQNRIKKEKKEHEAVRKYREEVEENMRTQGVCTTTKNNHSVCWGSEDDFN